MGFEAAEGGPRLSANSNHADLNWLPRIASIVVNTNEGPRLLGALETLQSSRHSEHEILVVDNASTDGSPEEVVRRFPDVEVLRLDDNRGYAAALNRGMSHIGGRVDAYFLLNPDIRVAPDCLTHLAGVVSKRPRVGIAGPSIYDPERSDELLASGSRVHPWTLATKHIVSARDAVADVPYTTGSAFLVTRDVYRNVGPMDESYFLYYEEVDYCFAAREAGYRVVIVPAAKVWHKDVSSRHEQLPHQLYFGHRNRIRFLKKHGTLAQRAFQAFYLPAIHAPFMSLELAVLRDLDAVRFYLYGVVDGLFTDEAEPTSLPFDSLFPRSR